MAARSGDRDLANAAAAEAWATAGSIGANHLSGQVEKLVRELGLRLSMPSPYGLTPRELEILRMLATGATNADIGTALSITANTVGVHVSNVLRKLDVRNRGQAVRLARSKGLVA